MIYGYARVSTTTQKVDRQIDELHRHGVTAIFVDKQSGKNFDRTQYLALLTCLTKGDTLFIKSLDRFGRNYKEIVEQWRIITKVKECDVVVLDMPLLDTRKEKNLLGAFISDIVLQILAFVAENERAYIISRSREGLALAKARGVRLGRPEKSLPACFEEAVDMVVNKQITKVDAAKMCDFPVSTFHRRMKSYLLGGE